MSGPLRFGLIGTGAISQTYAQAFLEFAPGRIVAVADPRLDAARSLAERLDCPAYPSHWELLARQPIDAAIVCTPPATHPEICTEILSRGIHVLCEKPLSIDSDSARRMVATAEEHGVVLTMASKFRFVEDVIKAHSIVTSGLLGEISLFENAFTGRVDMANRWNSDPEISGGGVLIDNGTHSLDLLRFFLGPIQDVHVVEGKRIQGLAVEDTVQVFARSTDDVLATIDLSWSISKEQHSFIDIYGTEGTLRVGWQRSCYRRARDRDWVVFGGGYDKVGAFRGQLANFCDSVHGIALPRVSNEDALASVRTVEAAYRSLADSNWVPVHGVVAA